MISVSVKESKVKLVKLKSISRKIDSPDWKWDSPNWPLIQQFVRYDPKFSYVTLTDFLSKFPNVFVCAPLKNKLRSISVGPQRQFI